MGVDLAALAPGRIGGSRVAQVCLGCEAKLTGGVNSLHINSEQQDQEPHY